MATRFSSYGTPGRIVHLKYYEAYASYILRNNVSLSLLARGATIDGISATKIREAILQGNDELLKQYVPNTVYEHRSVIKNHIELSNLIQFN